MCLYPLNAWQHKEHKGKLIFKNPSISKPTKKGNYILKNTLYNEMKVPCNNCSDCLKNRKSEWSLRLMHEASQCENNHFLTLTYADENLPEHHHLVYKHYQDFMKRLRFHMSKLDIKIRFLMSGEYGEKYGRPHYHAIIYNLPLPDLEHTDTINGNKFYESQIITNLWQHGAVKIGEVNQTTCMYVAKYMTKKDVSNWDGIDPETGEIIGELNDKGEITRVKPFHNRSTNPGIGHDWAKKWYKDFIPSGFIIYQGKKQPVPDYYLNVALREHPELEETIEAMKIERMLSLETEQYLNNNTPERLKTRIKYNDAIEKRYYLNKSIKEAFQ